MPTEFLLFGALGLLLVFMIFNTRRRTKQMKAEQEKKRQGTIPGAKVLLQGGLYGTIVSYDVDDLAAPAFVELAPGMVVEVHSQAILQVVDAEDESDAAYDTTDEYADDDLTDDVEDFAEDTLPDSPEGLEIPDSPAGLLRDSPEDLAPSDDTRARGERDDDQK